MSRQVTPQTPRVWGRALLGPYLGPSSFFPPLTGPGPKALSPLCRAPGEGGDLTLQWRKLKLREDRGL